MEIIIAFFLINPIYVYLRASFFCGTKNDTCSPNREKTAIFNDSTLFVLQDFIIYKCPCVTWPITNDILDFTIPFSTDIYNAVRHIYTGIVSFDRAVDIAPFHISSYDIVSHFQRNHLFIMENIFNDDNSTVSVFIDMLI